MEIPPAAYRSNARNAAKEAAGRPIALPSVLGRPILRLQSAPGLLNAGRVHRAVSLRANTTLRVGPMFFRFLFEFRHRLDATSGTEPAREKIPEHARNPQTNKRSRRGHDSDGNILVPICPEASIDMSAFFSPEEG